MKLVTFPDPILKTPAEPITDPMEYPADLVPGMVGIVDGIPALGLAAPQVGQSLRIIVFRGDVDQPPHVLVNPEVVEFSHERTERLEGCLSLPRVMVPVERSLRVKVRAENGYEAELRDSEARVVQHEIDHLDGILILDRTGEEHREKAQRALSLGTHYRPLPAGANGQPVENPHRDLGRNDPCHCGSGRKFKKCHGA